jgi:hypothetical protein
MRRWHEEVGLMKARMKLEREKHGVDPDNRDGTICHCLLGIGFVRKRKPYDCGRTRCGCCHFEKFYVPKARHTAKRRAIEENLAGWAE